MAGKVLNEPQVAEFADLFGQFRTGIGDHGAQFEDQPSARIEPWVGFRQQAFDDLGKIIGRGMTIDEIFFRKSVRGHLNRPTDRDRCRSAYSRWLTYGGLLQTKSNVSGWATSASRSQQRKLIRPST